MVLMLVHQSTQVCFASFVRVIFVLLWISALATLVIFFAHESLRVPGPLAVEVAALKLVLLREPAVRDWTVVHGFIPLDSRRLVVRAVGEHFVLFRTHCFVMLSVQLGSTFFADVWGGSTLLLSRVHRVEGPFAASRKVVREQTRVGCVVHHVHG